MRHGNSHDMGVLLAKLKALPCTLNTLPSVDATHLGR